MYTRKERLRIEKIEDELRRDVESMNQDAFNYDSVGRRWALCPHCNKKRPAWGGNNTLVEECICQKTIPVLSIKRIIDEGIKEASQMIPGSDTDVAFKNRMELLEVLRKFIYIRIGVN